jgi:hypothetical protein
MAFTSGSATNYHTLLTALKTYLESQGWTTLAFTSGTALEDFSELHIRFPGVNSFTGVLNIRTQRNVALGHYGWQSSVSKTWVSSIAWGGQFGESPSVFTNFWDQSLGYWFYVNDRRVIMSVKVSSVYASAFWGMFLPFTTPDEYNYPLYIGSNYSSLKDYAPLTVGDEFFIASPYTNTAYYMAVRGTWEMVENRKTPGMDSYSISAVGRLWPFATIRAANNFSSLPNDAPRWMAISRPNKNGEVPIIPCHIVSHSEKQMIGVLDGVHAIPGFGKGTEQQVTFSSRSFRLFQDLNRTTDGSYMAIEEL